MLPQYRRLRVFSHDPSLSTRLDTAVINETILNIAWEVDPKTGRSKLSPGPVGEYLEVVDYDPPSQCFYPPVDLNDLNLLAQDGLAPSVGNPQFHQQMVYAVAMRTIEHFEEALGRKMFWSEYLPRDPDGHVVKESTAKFVRRLRVYPHAFRQANAYYSPMKKALLFGYFPADDSAPQEIVPDSLIFTCLSHDIIVHETTHALLDGLHPRFTEPSGVDALAFHEAFADIVALLQHFSYPSILRHVIGQTRGDLESQNILGQLAQQFGFATGHRGALRSALGSTDKATGEWKRREPDPSRLERASEPHDRGAVLVAAIFDVFLAIYKSRIRDLVRIATSGTGILPEGHLHPDLVHRMANDAEKAARHILHICIRALDYCPPFGISFGDYLRALITADHSLHPADPCRYRVAILESFRQHGISPREIKTYSEVNLRWPGPQVESAMHEQRRTVVPCPQLTIIQRRESRTRRRTDKKAPKAIPPLNVDWDLNVDRFTAWRNMKRNSATLRTHWISQFDPDWAEQTLGIVLRNPHLQSVWTDDLGVPMTEVHSVRIARRLGPRGEFVTELVVEITQRRRGYLDEEKQEQVDTRAVEIFARDNNGVILRERSEYTPDFRFRGGCTLLLDPEAGAIRHVIKKNSILDEARLAEQRRFLMPGDNDLGVTYRGVTKRFSTDETFAMLHK